MAITERLISNTASMFLGILTVWVSLHPILQYSLFEHDPDAGSWALMTVEFFFGSWSFVHGLVGVLRDKQ